jgi:hypothetical protein
MGITGYVARMEKMRNEHKTLVREPESKGPLERNSHRWKNSTPWSLTEHHAIKAYWGNGGIAPRIIFLGTRRR